MNKGAPPDQKNTQGVLSSLSKMPESATFFPGCSLNRLAKTLSDTVYRWLKDNDICAHRFNGCCGLPSLFSGKEENYQKISAAVLSRFEKQGITTVITACPNCYYALSSRAKALESRVTPLALPEVFLKQGFVFDPSWFKDDECFTLHDSCPDREGLVYAKAMRKLLSGVPLKEMKHNQKDTLCCGAGQQYFDLCYEEQLAAAETRISEAEDICADRVITTCASCTYALASTESNTAVYHYLEVLFDTPFDG